MISTAWAAGGAASAFPPFDQATFSSQLFWLAVTFGGLYWLMNKVALPRMQSILETRAKTIARELKEASEAQAAAEKAAAEQEAFLAKARLEAEGIGRAAKEASAREADAKRTSIETGLNAKMVAAETSIAEAKRQAMSNVETIAAEAAVAIVERLSGATPSAAEIKAALAVAQGT